MLRIDEYDYDYVSNELILLGSVCGIAWHADVCGEYRDICRVDSPASTIISAENSKIPHPFNKKDLQRYPKPQIIYFIAIIGSLLIIYFFDSRINVRR
jgi:hypothetical protein